jgi:SET domain
MKCPDDRDDTSLDTGLRDILDRIEEFVKFTMVIRFNSVELQPPSEDGTGPGTNYGHGLFEKACKMNHSCKPNCVWKTTQDGICKEVRAISTIEKGEELTVDYCGNILDPTPQRRDELLATKGFICNCDRCAANHDDTRRFKCITFNETKCSGVHFLDQPTYSCKPSLSPCSRCDKVATESQIEKMIQEEVNLGNEINELDKAAEEHCIVEVQDRIARLHHNLPHPHHNLAEKCYRLQGELYSVIGEYRWAAEAYAKSIDCRVAIMGNDYYSQATAFTCEKLGEALEHVNLKESEVAYQRTVRSLEMIRGDAKSDPYSKCAVKKLLAVQNRRIHNDSKDLPLDLRLEGIAEAPEGPPDTSFPCQLCGNPAMIPASSRDAQRSYCSKFHKKAHLAVLRSEYCIEMDNEEKTCD